MSSFVKNFIGLFYKRKQKIGTEPSYKKLYELTDYNDYDTYMSNLSIHEIAMMIGDLCNSDNMHKYVKKLCVKEILIKVKDFLLHVNNMNNVEIDSITIIFNSLLLLEMFDDLHSIITISPNSFLMSYCNQNKRIFSVLSYLQYNGNDNIYNELMKWIDVNEYEFWKINNDNQIIMDNTEL